MVKLGFSKHKSPDYLTHSITFQCLYKELYRVKTQACKIRKSDKSLNHFSDCRKCYFPEMCKQLLSSIFKEHMSLSEMQHYYTTVA